jgi:hypothetical protein
MSQTVVSVQVGGTGANNASDARINLGAVNVAGDVITGTLNVAATLITQNVLPDANVTYDLGSSTARFKDLWLSNSTIYLGETSISANGNALVVPAMETVSGMNLEVEISTAYSQANAAYAEANLKLNLSGGTLSGTLNVNGAVSVTNTTGAIIAAQYGNIFTTSAVTSYTVDTFASATYRSAKYFAQQTSGSTYGVIELNLVHDGSTVYLVQYGENKTNASANLGDFDATISGGNLNLTYTPGSEYTTQTLKISRVAIPV